MEAKLASGVSAMGRLIRREYLFPRRTRNGAKNTRKPYDLKADGKWRIIEFDIKHVCLPCVKHCTFCTASRREKSIRRISQTFSRS